MGGSCCQEYNVLAKKQEKKLDSSEEKVENEPGYMMPEMNSTCWWWPLLRVTP